MAAARSCGSASRVYAQKRWPLAVHSRSQAPDQPALLLQRGQARSCPALRCAPCAVLQQLLRLPARPALLQELANPPVNVNPPRSKQPRRSQARRRTAYGQPSHAKPPALRSPAYLRGGGCELHGLGSGVLVPVVRVTGVLPQLRTLKLAGALMSYHSFFRKGSILWEEGRGSGQPSNPLSRALQRGLVVF